MLSSPQVRARLNRSCRSLRHVLFFLLFLVFWRETRAAPTDLPSLQDGSPRCCSSSHLLPVCEHPQWRMILGLLRRTLHAQDPNDLNRNVNLHKHPYKGGACLCFYNGRGDRCVDITALRLEDKTLRRMSQEVGDQDHGGNAISLSQFNVAVALSVCICLVGGFVLGAIARPFLNKLYRQHFGRRANKPPGEEVIAVYSNAALTNDQCNNSETNGDAKVQQQEHQPSSSNTLKGNSQAKEMKIRNAGYALKARENMLPMFDILNDDLSDTSSEVTMELDQHPSALQGWELLCKDAKGGAGAKWSQDNNDDALYEDLEVQNNQYSDFRVRGEFTQDSAGPVRCIGADKASLDHSSLMSHDDELDIEAWLSQNATLKIEQPDESDEDRGQHGHDNKNPFMDGKDALEETEQNPNGPLHMYTQHSKIKGNLTVEPLYLDIESHSENLRFNERSAREQEMAQDLYDLLQNPVYANEPVQRTRSDVRENVEAQTDLAYNTGKMNETVNSSERTAISSCI
uniref:Uncharacterized protein n=1 Tax=Eptatretus burgeri TaxID=7764 RepID=A0A8C4R287_EPTBU